jgi:hypothetical protein
MFGDVPVIGGWFAGPPIGVGILTAGIVLSLMVIPFVASVMRDVFETVPPQLKESAYGVGCTTWEVVTRIVLPYTRVGVIGGIMLGLGRALGETMAVTFVIGNANRIVGSLFAPGTSIASTLANEFGEADPGLHIRLVVRPGPGAVRHHLHRAGPFPMADPARCRQARQMSHHRSPAMTLYSQRRIRQPARHRPVHGGHGLRPGSP